MSFRDSAEDLLAARAAEAAENAVRAREEADAERVNREFEAEWTARLAATASPEEAAAAIAWLRERLEEELRLCANDEFRRLEVGSQLRMLDLHKPEPVSELDQRVWGCRAKCGDESWTSRYDTEDVVQSPCLHIKLLARPFAATGFSDFPAHLRLSQDEEG